MTTEERDFLDELMVSGLTEVSWQAAMADIVKLQTAKVFLDGLSAAGLSVETWLRAKADISELLNTKAFIDGLRTAGFSKNTWERVYTAALAAGGGSETDQDDDNPEDDIIELEDGTIIPEGFIGKRYRAKGKVTVGHFIVEDADFTIEADDIIIVCGIRFVITPDPGAAIFTIHFTKPVRDERYDICFSLNSCSVTYQSERAAAHSGVFYYGVTADKSVTVKSDYTLVLQNETVVNRISGFTKITAPVSQGYFIYDDETGKPYGVGFSSDGVVDIRVTYDEDSVPTFTGGEGTTLTVPWYNDVTLADDQEYPGTLKPTDRITVTNKGRIGRLVIITDTPITLVYDHAKGVKIGDIRVPTEYDITLIKAGDVFTVKVNEANVMIPEVGTVKLDITNSIVWLDNITAVYSKNHIVADIADSVLTGALNSFTGLLIGSFNNLTVNGELQNLSGVNQFAVEEGVNLYDFSHDIVLLRSNLLLDILKDYGYNPATMTYFWENVVEQEQATGEVVTAPLGDEETAGVTSLGMPLRIFRVYFRALAEQSGDLVCSLRDKHNTGLTAVSARKNFVD